MCGLFNSVAACTHTAQSSHVGCVGEYRNKEQKVWDKVCSIRQARLKFHSVRPGAHPEKYSLTDVYKTGGEFTQAFKASKADKWEGQSLLRAFVFCADTFDYRKQGSAKPPLE